MCWDNDFYGLPEKTSSCSRSSDTQGDIYCLCDNSQLTLNEEQRCDTFACSDKIESQWSSLDIGFEIEIPIGWKQILTKKLKDYLQGLR